MNAIACSPLATLLPSQIEISDRPVSPSVSPPLPEELPFCASMIDARRNQFAAGRNGIRTLMVQLGRSPLPVPVGKTGEPLLPPDLVGSISHTSSRCIAALGSADLFAGIGIDIEANKPLPNGSQDIIATRQELDGLPKLKSGIEWDTILFSVKESIYKAQFNITGRWLGFHEVYVRLNAKQRTFRAVIKKKNTILRPGLDSMEGRFIVKDQMIFTAISIPIDQVNRSLETWPQGE